jgi:hypothetical protein
MLTHRKNKQLGPIQVPDTAPLAQGVEDAANRLSAAVETASARTAKSAKSAKKNAKQAGDRASALGEQIGDRVSHAQSDLQRARRRRRLWLFIRRRNRIDDAILKAQLAKTSHELSRESTDLTHAVKSLNSVIKSNRKAAARGRTRLIGGVAIGALVMYHVDPEHGKERRKATSRRLKGVVGGSASS